MCTKPQGCTGRQTETPYPLTCAGFIAAGLESRRHSGWLRKWAIPPAGAADKHSDVSFECVLPPTRPVTGHLTAGRRPGVAGAPCSGRRSGLEGRRRLRAELRATLTASPRACYRSCSTAPSAARRLLMLVVILFAVSVTLTSAVSCRYVIIIIIIIDRLTNSITNGTPSPAVKDCGFKCTVKLKLEREVNC